MLIQPVQPVIVTIQIDHTKFECQMVSLSETELELTTNEYLEKETPVFFVAKYFKGKATIKDIKFAQYCFTYILEIDRIQFQPGLVINTRL